MKFNIVKLYGLNEKPQNVDGKNVFWHLYDVEMNVYEYSFLFGINWVGMYNINIDKLEYLLGEFPKEYLDRYDVLNVFYSTCSIANTKKKYIVTFKDKTVDNTFSCFPRLVIIKNNKLEYC